MLSVRIAISSDRDDRDVGSNRLGLGQQFKTGHARHIDVRQNKDDRNARSITNSSERRVAGWRKFHSEPAGTKIMPELLA